MKQIKIFTASMEESMEAKVNDWLKEMPHSFKILAVQYQEDAGIDNVLILYEGE